MAYSFNLVANEELNRLMDKHQLEEHKRLLSERTKTLVFSLVTTFFSLPLDTFHHNTQPFH